MAKPDQSPRPPPSHPPSKGPAHPGVRPSRDGIVADGMYVWECSSEGPCCLGRQKQSRLCLLEVPVDPRPLSPHCCLWPQVDIRPIPGAEPSQAESQFVLLSW